MDIPDTLFIDSEALVIDKPAMLDIGRPRRGGPCLEDQLGEMRFGFKREPTTVHRLDRDTSGCLLLARNPKAHKRFAAAFEQGQVEKHYLGILEGVPTTDTGTVSLALAKHSTREEGWRMIADENGKAAVTHWRSLKVVDGKALVAFRPETGRTHQIRAHAIYGIGIPLAGDPVYGSGDATLLHAFRLRLERDGKSPIDATAPMPSAFVSLGFDEDASTGT